MRTAEQVWKTAQQVKVAANAISDIELSRLRMLVELEKLSLARAEAAAATDSPLDDLAWENDQLRDEMARLRYRFEALHGAPLNRTLSGAVASAGDCCRGTSSTAAKHPPPSHGAPYFFFGSGNLPSSV